MALHQGMAAPAPWRCFLPALWTCLGPPRGGLAVQLGSGGGAAAGAAAVVTATEDPIVSYLGTDVPWSYCQTGFSCKVDAAHASGTIVIGSTTYAKGVSAHATSTMIFPLAGGGYTEFSTCYGIARGGSSCGLTQGMVTFTILADGVQLDQTVNKGPGEATCVTVDVTGRAELELSADAGSTGACDHASWADAKLAAPPGGGMATVTAVGDPHLLNFRGRKLDLHRTGNLTLLQIPKAASSTAAASGEVPAAEEGPAEELAPALPLLLRVDALAAHKGPGCAQSYLESLTVAGKWVEDRYPEGTRHYTASPKLADPTHRRHKTYLTLGPGIKLVIIHGKTDTGISYLNFRANGLERAESSIGGLLGDDGDDSVSWAESLPEGCSGASALHKKGTL